MTKCVNKPFINGGPGWATITLRHELPTPTGRHTSHHRPSPRSLGVCVCVCVCVSGGGGGSLYDEIAREWVCERSASAWELLAQGGGHTPPPRPWPWLLGVFGGGLVGVWGGGEGSLND